MTEEGPESVKMENLLNLNSQFPGGREDESLCLSQLNVNLLQHCNGKGGRLPCPRLGPR